MTRLLTCTWAPTVFQGPQLLDRPLAPAPKLATGETLAAQAGRPVAAIEAAGVDFLLIAQRWWGSGVEIEGSSLDCLAMTAFYAAQTSRLKLITAIHPGFFMPASIAKWGATLDRITNGRWAINVTSGWNLEEFEMYGVDPLEHDTRYARTAEFIDVLRGAWREPEFSYDGRYYRTRGLRLEPRPTSRELMVFQGGQSEAARDLAASHSDWMFLNGGRPERVRDVIQSVRKRCEGTGRRVRFALYGIPLCRESDAEAEDEIATLLARQNPERIEQRRARTGGARGMWSIEEEDELSHLDTNEGFVTRLIGSPDTIERRMREYQALGVDCFHLMLSDSRFVREVLPRIQQPLP